MVVTGSGYPRTLTVYSLPDGAMRSELYSYGTKPGEFQLPMKTCFSPRNPNNLFIADYGNKRVQVSCVCARSPFRFFLHGITSQRLAGDYTVWLARSHDWWKGLVQEGLGW